MNPDTSGGLPAEDAALLAELQDALTPVPAALLERLFEGARAAYSYRTMEEELAALAHDSLLDDSPAVARNAPATARTLLFESATTSVQVEVTDDDVVGQVVAAAPVTVTMEGADGQRTEVECDEAGCFTLPRPGAGPVRLCLEADGVVTRTEWTHLRPPA